MYEDDFGIFEAKRLNSIFLSLSRTSYFYCHSILMYIFHIFSILWIHFIISHNNKKGPPPQFFFECFPPNIANFPSVKGCGPSANNWCEGPTHLAVFVINNRNKCHWVMLWLSHHTKLYASPPREQSISCLDWLPFPFYSDNTRPTIKSEVWLVQGRNNGWSTFC